MQSFRTVGAAAAETGWSARMLRSLEEHGLVTPRRTDAGYRLYGLAELNRLRTLKELRRRFGVELSELASGGSRSSATPSTPGSQQAMTQAHGSSGSSASTSAC